MDNHRAPHRSEYQSTVPERRDAMMTHVMQFVQEQEGATALEYGLLAALIAAVIIGAVQTLGTTISTTFTNIEASMSGS